MRGLAKRSSHPRMKSTGAMQQPTRQAIREDEGAKVSGHNKRTRLRHITKTAPVFRSTLTRPQVDAIAVAAQKMRATPKKMDRSARSQGRAAGEGPTGASTPSAAAAATVAKHLEVGNAE